MLSTPQGELPFFREVMAEADFERIKCTDLGMGFTLRHARITPERSQEYVDRLFALALEFSAEPREGNIEHAMIVGIYTTTRPVGPGDDHAPSGRKRRADRRSQP